MFTCTAILLLFLTKFRVNMNKFTFVSITSNSHNHIGDYLCERKQGWGIPILVLSMSTSKALTRFSKNIRTSLKLTRPMLHDPSTRNTISAMASVWHTNWLAKTQEGWWWVRQWHWLEVQGQINTLNTFINISYTVSIFYYIILTAFRKTILHFASSGYWVVG